MPRTRNPCGSARRAAWPPVPRPRSASTAGILREVGLSPGGREPQGEWRRKMNEPLPLAGLVVLDISSFIAAPAAAVALADYGADVIDRATGRRRPAPPQLQARRHLPQERPQFPPAARRPPEALAGARPQECRGATGAGEADQARRRHDRELSTAGPRAAEVGLGGHRADQSAPGLLLVDRYGETGPDRDRPAST